MIEASGSAWSRHAEPRGSEPGYRMREWSTALAVAVIQTLLVQRPVAQATR
jgi:hypothetical protein